MASDDIEVIDSAYRRPSAAAEELQKLTASSPSTERLDNAEVILEAKNDKTASLHLHGLPSC